jgi:hypothetical protein
MWKCFWSSQVAVLAWALVSCGTAPRKAALVPEAEQAIGEELKQLYMAASTAAPHSAEQQKLILRMAERASNGKELLLAMRAAVGVFPAESGDQGVAERVRAIVTKKMMQLATLDQLTDYAAQYQVDPASARGYVKRMFELGAGNSDPRAWYRIRSVASHLKVSDLQQQAEAKGNELAGK